MNEIRHQVRVDHTVLVEFKVMTNEGGVLSPFLQHQKSIHNNILEIKIGETIPNVLGFVNDLNLVGESKEMVIQNTKTVGLKHVCTVDLNMRKKRKRWNY